MLKKLLFLTWSITLLSQVYASVGNISLLRGTADIDRQSSIIEAKVLMDIEEQDKVSTKEDTKMQITFKDDTVITLGALTSFEVEEYLEDEKNSKASFSVSKGAFKVITGKIGKLAPKSFILKTKSSSIGIRGTIFVGEVNFDNLEKDYISCLDGSIVVTSFKTNETITLHSGEMVIIYPNGMIEQPPSLSTENFSLLTHATSTSKDSIAKKDISDEEDDKNDEETQESHTLSQEDTNQEVIEKRKEWSDDLRVEEKHDKDTIGIISTPLPKPPKGIQDLINKNQVHNYTGKSTGSFSQTQTKNTDTIKMAGNIKADIGMEVDFGGNAPMELSIKNQTINLSSITKNSIQAPSSQLDSISKEINSKVTDTLLQMDTTSINKDNASLTSTKNLTSGGLAQEVKVDGTFRGSGAKSFDGKLQQTSQGNVNGAAIKSQMNVNLDLSRN